MRFRALARALERAIRPECPVITFLLAVLADPSRMTETFAGDWVAAAAVETVAVELTEGTVSVDLARPFALESRPSRLAHTLTSLAVAISSIFAIASL